MSALEYAEWQAWYRISPFGPWRSDWNAGAIASTVANVNRSKNTPEFQPSDFMLKLPETRAQKSARIKAALKAAARKTKRPPKE